MEDKKYISIYECALTIYIKTNNSVYDVKYEELSAQQ